MSTVYAEYETDAQGHILPQRVMTPTVDQVEKRAAAARERQSAAETTRHEQRKKINEQIAQAQLFEQQRLHDSIGPRGKQVKRAKLRAAAVRCSAWLSVLLYR